MKHDPKLVGKYCYLCGSDKVESLNTAKGEQFVCDQGHQSPRVYFFDGKAIQHIEEGELVHETVGAIIRRQVNNEVLTLLFLRKKFPFQYTIPAGHLEKNESAEACAKREVEEETGLQVETVKPISTEEPLKLFDPCRRGADYHYWHLFSVETRGEPRLSDEGRIMGWYTQEEIRHFRDNDLLTKSVAYFFK